jgi:hypothetical protein
LGVAFTASPENLRKRPALEIAHLIFAWPT